jgi:glutamate/tyrosine decarboxylase-like PLP-dependent enzyme
MHEVMGYKEMAAEVDSDAGAVLLGGQSGHDARSTSDSESLDPVDWDAFRSLTHALVDRAVDHMNGSRRRPAWQQVPEESESYFRKRLPQEGTPLPQLVDEFFTHVLPYPTGNSHPRFWGWVGGAGTPGGVIAETLTALMNSVPGNFNDAPARVEDQVLEWMRHVIGFPTGASGIVTSGGSVANLIGIAAGRDEKAGYNTVEHGVHGGQGRLSLYASTQVHSSVVKAAQLLGLGRDAVRLVRVNDAHEIDVGALEEQVTADRTEGWRPFAVVGNAGTVNTGAVDDLAALAALARREDLWFHVDGAFGALLALSPGLKHLINGMEQADSVAFDFHKWMSVQYDAGCVLIRDAEAHRRPFAISAEYLAPFPRGTAARVDTANMRGPQLSRSFRALKVWMTIREHGLAKFGRIVEQNVRDAQYLARQIDEAPDFERLAPAPINVVTFRYNPGDLDTASLNDLNKELLMQVQESGVAIPSSTLIDGRFALRVANVNHRTVPTDFDLLLTTIRSLGERELARDT